MRYEYDYESLNYRTSFSSTTSLLGSTTHFYFLIAFGPSTVPITKMFNTQLRNRTLNVWILTLSFGTFLSLSFAVVLKDILHQIVPSVQLSLGSFRGEVFVCRSLVELVRGLKEKTLCESFAGDCKVLTISNIGIDYRYPYQNRTSNSQQSGLSPEACVNLVSLSSLPFRFTQKQQQRLHCIGKY